MPDIETPDSDALEQQQDADGPAEPVDAGSELSPETPEEDAAEQRAPMRESPGRLASGGTVEADEGDLAESEREVPFDDDDYR